MTNVKEENLSPWNSLSAVIERYSHFLTAAADDGDFNLAGENDVQQFLLLSLFFVFFFAESNID